MDEIRAMKSRMGFIWVARLLVHLIFDHKRWFSGLLDTTMNAFFFRV